MELQLDEPDYEALSVRVERAMGRLDEVKPETLTEQAKRGFELMLTDGSGVLDILKAASRTRTLPVSFFSEVDVWLETVERVVPA